MLICELYGVIATAAPLYHFTPLGKFYAIIDSNKLIAQASPSHDDPKAKSSSFTRDPRRTFIPSTTGEGVGFRVDRNKLAHHYKLVPSKHNTMKRSAWVGGKEITQAEEQRQSRFESEERVYKDIPNFLSYVTGIVLPKTGKTGRIGSAHIPTPTDVAMTILDLSGAFDAHTERFADSIRSRFMKAIRKLNVPLIMEGKTFDLGEIEKEIRRITELKTSNPTEFYKLLNTFFHMSRGEMGEPRPERFSKNTSIARGSGMIKDIMDQ